MQTSMRVADWFAWSPGRSDRQAWRAWAGTQQMAMADPAAAIVLPMLLRRRLSPLGQALLAAALACGDAACRARLILATRHGELSRTVNILQALSDATPPSPADFSLSVHHSLLGLLSIHTGNRHAHAAISAGGDSFVCGLLEASACLHAAPEEPVLLLFAEEALPPPYDEVFPDAAKETPLALALLLTKRQGTEIASLISKTGSMSALEFLHAFLKAEVALADA